MPTDHWFSIRLTGHVFGERGWQVGIRVVGHTVLKPVLNSVFKQTRFLIRIINIILILIFVVYISLQVIKTEIFYFVNVLKFRKKVYLTIKQQGFSQFRFQRVCFFLKPSSLCTLHSGSYYKPQTGVLSVKPKNKTIPINK